MSPIKFIAFAALVGAGYLHWSESRNMPAPPAEAAPLLMQGFVASPVFQGEARDAVTIFTTADISDVALSRATDLARELESQSIPAVMAKPLADADAARDGLVAGRIAAIRAGDQPLVVIRGKTKSNPLSAAVVLEYGR